MREIWLVGKSGFLIPVTCTMLFLHSVAAFTEPMERKGDWSSAGGGSGVACFPSANDAAQADPFIQKGELLPPHLLNLAEIQVLEHWEMLRNGTAPWVAPKNSDWKSIHREIKTAIRRAYPLFADRLQIAGNFTRFARWENQTGISLLEDAHPQSPLPPNCRRIQLALRYSNGNNPIGVGPVREKIELKVVFSQEYFSRLSPLDQAMLVLHEELYVLGQAVGHPSSDSIRGFTRIFSSRDFVDYWKQQASPHFLSESDALVKRYLIHEFGDYVLFFSQYRGHGSGPRFSSLRHYRAFMELLEANRSIHSACLDQGRPKQECLDSTLSPPAIAPRLNDEAAFIYMSFFALEQTLGVLNSDYVLRPQPDDREYQEAVNAACEEIRALDLRGPIIGIQNKALSYCRDLNSAR